MATRMRLFSWRGKRSVFWLFLASYIAISAVSLPLTAYSYMRFDSVLQAKVGAETHAQLKQAAQQLDAMFSSVEKALTTLSINTQNSSLSYGRLPLRPDGVYQLTQYMQRVQDVYHTCDALYDLYTYFPTLDSIVTRAARYDAVDYYRIFLRYQGIPYAQWHAEMNAYTYLSYAMRTIQGTQWSVRNVLTLTLSVTPVGNSTIRANTVAVVDSRAITQAFLQTNFIKSGQVVIQANGSVLCSIGQTLYDPESLLENAPFQAEEAVWANYGEQPVLLLSSGTAGAGIRYFCVVPAKAYTGELMPMRRLIIMILFIEFLLGIVLSVAFAWMHFSPIRKAAKRLSGHIRDGGGQRNEIDLIAHTSLALLDENQRIAKALSEQKQVMRSSLLRQLLQGGHAVSHMALEGDAFKFPNPCFAVLLLHIEDGGNFNAEDSMEQQILLVYTLLNLLEDHFEAHFPCHAAEMDAERIALLVNLPDGISAERLWSICCDYNDFCFAEMGVLLSGGISGLVRSTLTIAGAYQQAVAALTRIRLWQSGNIALFDQITRDTPTYIYTQSVENTVMHSIRLCQLETLSDTVDSVLRQCEGHSIASVRCLCYDMVGTGMKLLSEIGMEPERVFAQEEPIAAIDQGSTIQDMRKAALSILFSIAEALKTDRTTRNEELCQQVDTLIDANFFNSNFSLTMAAEALGLNASYLSFLYKRETGKNFIDAIGQKRIARAKQLLRETETPVTQIALQCGYISAGYFSRAFKRHEGCTPGQYRQL